MVGFGSYNQGTMQSRTIARILAALSWGLVALPEPACANVVGGDLQNFNAVPGGIDYVTVQSSETLEPGYFNVSLMTNHAVNILPYYGDDAGKQKRTSYNDSLTMFDFGAGAGLTDSLEIGFAAQDLISQEVSGGSHGQFGTKGIINYRLYGKWQFFGDSEGGGAVVLSNVFNRVTHNPYVGKDGSDIHIVELAGDTTIQKIAVAVNLGYRFRKKGEQLPDSLIQPVGNQYIGSIGTSYLLPSIDTKLVLEAFGSRPADERDRGVTARQASSAELLAGLKYDVTSNVSAHVGGGTELMRGVSTPDWRVYAGVNIAIGPAFEREKAAEPPVYHSPTKPAEERSILQNINFATGSDDIPAEAIPELEGLAKQIRSSVYEKIFVEGHTDSVGSAESNLELSQRRANTVRQWLIDHAGVLPTKIEAQGFGEVQPLADNGNLQGRRRNRRVEVRVLRPLPGM